MSERYTLPEGKALVLRTCAADMSAYGGFVWPQSGPVEAPDWNPDPVCGGGLHGLLWGFGSVSYLDHSDGANWLIVEVESSDVVEIDGDKVKYPRGVVVFCGKRDDAVSFMYASAPDQSRVGNYGTATAGYYGTATAGDKGTATAGDEGTATAGAGGVIAIQFWDGKRYKTQIATVKDEDGDGDLEPNVKYRLDESGAFVPVAEAQ